MVASVSLQLSARPGGSADKVEIGDGAPLVIIAGPCVIEGRDRTLRIAEATQRAAAAAGVPLIFKASFDKANRTSAESFRGPGLHDGLEVLAQVRDQLGLPLTTDVHLPDQVAAIAQVVDLLQVPAFLCRQTDLLVACARSGVAVNVKKGQFLAPWDMRHVVAKVQSAGASGTMLTERGSSFGYNNLVADMRSLPIMRGLGVPVCFDCTHAVQLPGGQGSRSGGQREHAPVLARAAVVAGADAVFMEVHDDPDNALSDGPNMLPLEWLPGLFRQLSDLHALVRASGLGTPWGLGEGR